MKVNGALSVTKPAAASMALLLSIDFKFPHPFPNCYPPVLMNEVTYYYADAESRQAGPVTYQELSRLAAEGAIHEKTAVLRAGETVWTRWGEVPPPSPVHFAQKASAFLDQVGNQLGTLGFDDFSKGLYFALLTFLLLPWQLLSHSFATLSLWGKEGKLPDSDIEFPTLSFVLTIVRPAGHAFLTLTALIWILTLFFSSAWNGGDFLASLSWLVLALASVYFGNLFLGFFLDLLTLLVAFAARQIQSPRR